MRRVYLVLCLLFISQTSGAAEERIPYSNPMDQLTFHEKESDHSASDRPDIVGRLAFMDVYDPFEPLNRLLFRFNVRLDRYFLKPLMNLYEAVAPTFIRQGIANFFQNIKDVPNTLNNLAQLKGEAALTSGSRLLLNTTFGLLGVFDPAERAGLKYRRNDLGMTLAYYGMGAGPYLMIPVFGPYNLRDASGMVGELWVEDRIDFLGIPDKTFSDPALFAVYGINYRYEIQFTYDDFLSPFTYDMIRFLYTRKRELELIAGGD